VQYKSTKSKRLDELEARAREFEVLHSVSLSKIIALLQSKETTIESLKAAEASLSGQIQHESRVS
jgi:hypothetical protein